MAKEYEVEAVQGRRRDKKGKLEYLLSWVGYEERTWTPVAKCGACREKIAEFEAAHPQTAPSTPAATPSTARTPRRSGKRDTTPANSGRAIRSSGRKQSTSTSRKEDTPESEAPPSDAPATLASVLSPVVTPATSPKKAQSNGDNDEPIDISSGEESDGGIEIVDTPSKGKGRGRPKSAKSGAVAARTGSSSSERPTTSTAARTTRPVTSPAKTKVTDILELTDTDEDERKPIVLPVQPSSGGGISTKAINGSPAKKKARSPSKSDSEGEKSDEEEEGGPASILARGRAARRDQRSPANKKSKSPRKSGSEGEEEADVDEGKKAGRGRPARSNPSSPVKKNAKAPSESASEGEKEEADVNEGKKTAGRGRPPKSNQSSPVKKPEAKSNSNSGSEDEEPEHEDNATKKAGRGRGRPPRGTQSSPVKKSAARSRSRSESTSAEESEADEDLRTSTTKRGRGRPTRGNKGSVAKKKPSSKSESEESESEKNSEDEKIKKMKSGGRKRTRSMGSPSDEEAEKEESEEEEEEDEERESRPRMIGRHPSAAGPPPKNRQPWGTRTRDSSEESAFNGDRGGRKRTWKKKAVPESQKRKSTIKRARVNLAEPEIVTSESEESDKSEESEGEQATKRKTTGTTGGRRGRPRGKAAQSDSDEPMEMPSARRRLLFGGDDDNEPLDPNESPRSRIEARKAKKEQEAAASRKEDTMDDNDDDDSIIASPRRNQNRSHVIDVSDDDDEVEVVEEEDEESDEEGTPATRARGIPSVDDFLSELIIEQSYVVPIKVPLEEGDEPEPAGPESDYEPPARPARIVTPHELPRIGVWTRESYEEQYVMPSSRRREDESEKERACDRDVIRVVAYCSDPVHPFLFAQLAMKEDEDGLPIQEAVQAFHSVLASHLFPRAYSAFVQRMVTTFYMPETADRGAGPSRRNPAPAKKPAKARAANLEVSANHAAERAKRAGKRGG